MPAKFFGERFTYLKYFREATIYLKYIECLKKCNIMTIRKIKKVWLNLEQRSSCEPRFCRYEKKYSKYNHAFKREANKF